MTDLQLIVSEAERNMLPTLSRLSQNDVDNIWSYVAAYIERQMSLQKGVQIAGLGTFTFSQQKLDVGNKFIMVQRPIFLLAVKLAQFQNLKQSRPLAAAANVPVAPLNYTAVSQEGPFQRSVVEGCVRESLLLLLRALASRQDVLLSLQGMGVLSFKNNKVRMKFNKDFVNAMDATGSLLLSCSNRPGSSGSLMSGRVLSCQRPRTAGPPRLPTVVSPERGNQTGDREGQSLPPAPERDAAATPYRSPRPCQTPLPGSKVTRVSPTEDMEKREPAEAAKKCSVSFSPLEGTPREDDPHRDVRCSGHARAGQELCYLCMQRAQRNVPLYLQEERTAQEKAQEMLLLLQQQKEDQLYLQNQEMNENKQRALSKQVAAFNLEVSQTLEEDRAQCTQSQVQGSYIFAKRPLTAALQAKKLGYMDELRDQVIARRQRNSQTQQERLLLERVDQLQLAQEVALQRNQQLLQKQQREEQYRRALDTQVEHGKATSLQQELPISAGFGRCEAAASAEFNRERAQKVFQEQLLAATQKKGEELFKRKTQQKDEQEMLHRNRKELILERISRFEKMKHLRASLEDSWRSNNELKLRREEDEKRFHRCNGGLLLDQCDQYRRCHQCNRKPSNRGESNIWRESYYISGSQLMM